MSQDFENDSKRELSITDPSGNNMTIEPSKCPTCGAPCVHASEYCKGEVNMMSDMHLCEEHRREAPNNWFDSEPSKTESPFPRELGSDAKEASNFGFTFTDEEDYNGKAKE